MFITARTRSRGISMVEILIALGILVVFLSFASTSISHVSSKAELRSAVENMEFSIRMARTTARQLDTGVVMHLNLDPVEKRNSVTFSFPTDELSPASNSLLQEFQFPPTIRLVSDVTSVNFDQRGMVPLPVKVMLVSNQNEDLNQLVVID